MIKLLLALCLPAMALASPPDRGHPEAAFPNPERPDRERPDLERPDLERPDPGRPDPGRLDPGRLDPGRPDSGCPHRGSRWVAARWTEGPPLSGGRAASHAPAWRIYTPAHREVVPRRGHRIARTRQLPCVLVRYACTGLWLHPIVLQSEQTIGYVTDAVDIRCG